MKKQFSFKGCSRLTIGCNQSENIPILQSNYESNHTSKNAWTDMRVQQIKRKYDTPSNKRKKNGSLKCQEAPKQFRLSLNRNQNSTIQPLKQSQSTNMMKRQNQKQLKFLKHKAKNASTYELEQNEKTVFKKIQQMKNCLMNQKQIKENCVNKDLKKYRDYPQYQINPRVSNIDKINNKIKRILDCLHQNQNHIKKQRSQLMKNSIMSKDPNLDQFQETHILQRQKVNKNSSYDNSLLIKSNFQGKLQNNFKFYRETKSPQQIDQSLNVRKVQPLKNSQIIKLRSKSCLNLQKFLKKTNQSNKKLDHEICKITTRIKEFQEQKKKLNIQFKPFNYEMKGTKSVEKLMTTNSNKNFKPPLPSKSKFLQFTRPRHQRSITDFKLRIQTQQNTVSCLNISNEHQKLQKIFSQKSESAQSLCDSKKTSLNTSSIEINDLKNIQKSEEQKKIFDKLRVQTDEGIKNRKKKLLQTTTITFTKQTKKLIQQLYQQVKLDQNYRNSKIWLRDAMIQNKQKKIQQILRSKGILKENQELIKQYEVCEEQDNPFFSVRDHQNSLQILVQNKIKAQEHWDSEIVHQFSKQQLENEKFTSQKIDLDNKGYFVLEDLVRFINMQIGTFYRNRDLFLIFNRLTKTNKMNFSHFIDVLASDVI